MPTTPTYPGVYIEELENPVKTIVGVSTSRTAFIGRALQGPVDEPTVIFSFGDFERFFGGLWKESTMSYAVYQYFQNGGKEAIIVRVVNGGKKAIFSNTSEANLKFEAANEGMWANDLRISVDHDVNDDADDAESLFNVRIKRLISEGEDEADNEYVELESFLNVSFAAAHKKYVVKVIEDESQLIRVNNAESMILTARPADALMFEPVVADEGTDGDQVNATSLTGSESAKTGIYALDKTDIFNMLCIPPPIQDDHGHTDPHYGTTYTAAAAYCIDERAILLVDPPTDWNSPADAVANIDGAFALSRTENAAIYYPLIRAPDPKEEGRYRTFVPCGVVAGIIAKTDAQRGIWKAPAGMDAVMMGVPELEYRMTDEENGTLNPLGVNCLRVLPVTGRVVWGARTMKGADRLANQWKYLPVRRTALYIEESLYRGTQWVVFEPNDEPLWAQIRLNIGAFMHDLFRKGAFQGSTPKEAYLVKCDKETTTQYDIDRGIVNIVVGFAPLKPAEFVIIKIQQLAGQTEAL